MATSSKTEGQAPPGIVQRNVLTPIDKPVTAVLASDAFVNVPLPLISDQIPPAEAVADNDELEEQIV